MIISWVKMEYWNDSIWVILTLDIIFKYYLWLVKVWLLYEDAYLNIFQIWWKYNQQWTPLSETRVRPMRRISIISCKNSIATFSFSVSKRNTSRRIRSSSRGIPIIIQRGTQIQGITQTNSGCSTGRWTLCVDDRWEPRISDLNRGNELLRSSPLNNR